MHWSNFCDTTNGYDDRGTSCFFLLQYTPFLYIFIFYIDSNNKWLNYEKILHRKFRMKSNVKIILWLKVTLNLEAEHKNTVPFSFETILLKKIIQIFHRQLKKNLIQIQKTLNRSISPRNKISSIFGCEKDKFCEKYGLIFIALLSFRAEYINGEANVFTIK